MANQEHLDILKQGVDAWNRWRQQFPDARLDLMKANLSGVDLIEANLSEADLSEANLSLALLGVPVASGQESTLGKYH